MALRWTTEYRKGSPLVWESEVASDVTGEVARIVARPWPHRGMQWTCGGEAGTDRNVTDAKRSVLAAYMRSGGV